ncbi:hypothetical protein [Xenorhabdus sp. PB30.3]|uniref:hypothetical protein n=1 Tax=Xenorhabdus sp. PB30.3 TaxID=2788941 RepID=UPI001E4DA3ED|nr:hypothetical protein [Xenorhabdus sp. PB30.3]MCC8381935.1 hypothetical protein [Xenorhabdus sp. PB30.3]
MKSPLVSAGKKRLSQLHWMNRLSCPKGHLKLIPSGGWSAPETTADLVEYFSVSDTAPLSCSTVRLARRLLTFGFDHPNRY